MSDLATATWLRSARCTNGSCVEVAFLDGKVAVRDSKDKDGPVLWFTSSEWNVFLKNVRNGNGDLGQHQA